MTYYNFALVKAINSVLNTANKLHNLKGEDVCDYNKVLKDRLASSLNDILDLDLNLPESNDNNKCIFLLSLSAHNNALNNKLVLTLLLHNTNMPSKDLHSRITFVKDIQSAFTITGSLNASLKISSKDCDY
jgi:hypothetical protein